MLEVVLVVTGTQGISTEIILRTQNTIIIKSQSGSKTMVPGRIVRLCDKPPKGGSTHSQIDAVIRMGIQNICKHGDIVIRQKSGIMHLTIVTYEYTLNRKNTCRMPVYDGSQIQDVIADDLHLLRLCFFGIALLVIKESKDQIVVAGIKDRKNIIEL